MQQYQPLTIQEKLKIEVQAIELKKQGMLDEAEKLEQLIPMPPWLAKFAKKYMGADFLIKYKWNLSEADAEYGPNWLSQ